MKAKNKNNENNELKEDIENSNTSKCECNHEECDCQNKECCCNDTPSEEETINNELESEDMLILKNNIATLEEKLRYQQAELINYRKRKDDEVSNLLKYANQDLIMELLPLVDNFERAIKASESDEGNAKIKEGINMLYTNLVNTLHKFGVEEINSDSVPFDPVYHEALLIANEQDKEDGLILETLVRGYTYKGRVIRPSSVKVNKLS